VLAGDYDLPFKFYGLILAYIFIAGFLYGRDWDTLASLFVFTGLLLSPASIMVLALNQSFVDALNPNILWRLVVRIGWSYLALYGLILVLQIARSNAVALLAGGIHWGFYHLVTGYFTILTFHIMGYILYQNHELVGQPVDEEEMEEADHRFDHYQNMMAIDNMEAAMAELEQLADEYPADLDIHRRLHAFYLLERKGEKLAAHANKYLVLLLGRQQQIQAAEVYLDCLALDKRCIPDDAEDCYRMAQALNRSGKYKEMVKFLNGLHKCFPNSDYIPHAYFLMAKTLNESLDKGELAVKTLHFIIENYPQHPVIPDIRTYLEVMHGNT
jgi:tetratricopeptide (TPR) repeat protein